MANRSDPELLTIAEAIERHNLDTLRPLGQWVSREAPSRKQDLVPFLTQMLARPDVVRRLYESLDKLSKEAVQEALDSPVGRLDPDRFQAKYGKLPGQGDGKSPARLHLFMTYNWTLPTDLRPILKEFVPQPRGVSISSDEELPATVPEQIAPWRLRNGEKPGSIPLQQRATASSAQREIAAMLRLLEAGKLRVGEKTRKPGQATLEAVAPMLLDGEFYQADDNSKYHHDPGFDLAIKAFAWPCILQAAGLASSAGGKLALSPAGRKAMGRPAHDLIRNAWGKWVKTTVFDEFERIEVIKGKQGARIGGAADRRRSIADVLADCPVSRWIAVDEFFRFLRASGENFQIARVEWKLYISMQEYGHFGHGGNRAWLMLEGRYILAVLFEYAATLGLIDVAYIPPQRARNEFREHWGTDDYECLSRYDGLKFIRLNALGAWCLGLTEDYEPEPIVVKKTWKVLPNHDVVSSEQNPDPGDVLFLERVAEKTSERVWRLDREKILTAAEAGLDIEEIAGFLEVRSDEPIPATVATLLDDLRQRAGLLRDKGTVRMIECADTETARLLLVDSKLKSLCLPAGDRSLVFREADQAAVRGRLRKLGYVVPSGG
jgi:Helicase conserved C-terminal domain